MMTNLTGRRQLPAPRLSLSAFHGILRAAPLAAMLWAGILFGTGIIH